MSCHIKDVWANIISFCDPETRGVLENTTRLVRLNVYSIYFFELPDTIRESFLAINCKNISKLESSYFLTVDANSALVISAKKNKQPLPVPTTMVNNSSMMKLWDPSLDTCTTRHHYASDCIYPFIATLSKNELMRIKRWWIAIELTRRPRVIETSLSGMRIPPTTLDNLLPNPETKNRTSIDLDSVESNNVDTLPKAVVNTSNGPLNPYDNLDLSTTYPEETILLTQCSICRDFTDIPSRTKSMPYLLTCQDCADSHVFSYNQLIETWKFTHFQVDIAFPYIDHPVPTDPMYGDGDCGLSRHNRRCLSLDCEGCKKSKLEKHRFCIPFTRNGIHGCSGSGSLSHAEGKCLLQNHGFSENNGVSGGVCGVGVGCVDSRGLGGCNEGSGVSRFLDGVNNGPQFNIINHIPKPHPKNTYNLRNSSHSSSIHSNINSLSTEDIDSNVDVNGDFRLSDAYIAASNGISLKALNLLREYRKRVNTTPSFSDGRIYLLWDLIPIRLLSPLYVIKGCHYKEELLNLNSPQSPPSDSPSLTSVNITPVVKKPVARRGFKKKRLFGAAKASVLAAEAKAKQEKEEQEEMERSMGVSGDSQVFDEDGEFSPTNNHSASSSSASGNSDFSLSVPSNNDSIPMPSTPLLKPVSDGKVTVPSAPINPLDHPDIDISPNTLEDHNLAKTVNFSIIPHPHPQKTIQAKIDSYATLPLNIYRRYVMCHCGRYDTCPESNQHWEEDENIWPKRTSMCKVEINLLRKNNLQKLIQICEYDDFVDFDSPSHSDSDSDSNTDSNTDSTKTVRSKPAIQPLSTPLLSKLFHVTCKLWLPSPYEPIISIPGLILPHFDSNGKYVHGTGMREREEGGNQTWSVNQTQSNSSEDGKKPESVFQQIPTITALCAGYSKLRDQEYIIDSIHLCSLARSLAESEPYSANSPRANVDGEVSNHNATSTSSSGELGMTCTTDGACKVVDRIINSARCFIDFDINSDSDKTNSNPSDVTNPSHNSPSHNMNDSTNDHQVLSPHPTSTSTSTSSSGKLSSLAVDMTDRKDQGEVEHDGESVPIDAKHKRQRIS